MKKILLSILLLLLSGCSFGPVEEVNQTSFKIADSVFSVTLPQDWSSQPLDSKKGEVIVAQKADQNFIIMRQYPFQDNVSDSILGQFKSDFFSFQILEKNINTWKFYGKLKFDTPQREFHQKVIPVAGTSEFLIGSCSFDHMESRESDCPNILKNWEISSGKN